LREGIVATEAGLPTQKYHVAPSFAGEDRAYVEKVATYLKAEGVSVFYDRLRMAKDEYSRGVASDEA
jgi:hypothetical protein